jgi:dynein heavy chain
MTFAMSLVNTALKHGLPMPSKKLFHELSVVPFLTEMQPGFCFDRDREPECNPEWSLMDEVSIQNVHLVMKQCIINQWIVVIDSQRFALSWIRNTKKEIKVVKYGSPSLRRVLDQCLTSGSPLLIFDIEPEVLLTDPMLFTILCNTDKFDKPPQSFKIAVGGQEVDCAPGFKLFLFTTVPLKKLSIEFLSSFVVVQFVPTFDGIEMLLLNRYIRLEKLVFQEAKRMSSEEINAIVDRLESLETTLLTSLITKQGQSVLDNATDKELLLSSAQEVDQAKERMFMALDHRDSLYAQQRDAAKDIAHRGAVLFGVAQCIASMNPLYQITLENFLVLFDEAIQGTDKTVHQSIVDRLTHVILWHLSQGVKEEDRLFLEILLAIETEQAAGRCSAFEKKFLLSPQSIASDVYSNLVNVGTVPSGVPTPNVKVFGKKPYDWMTEDQWHNIQILGFMFDWFSEAVERISKEGRESVWKHICEHDMPQSVALPENLDDRISPIQKLICLRTIRPEKFIEIAKIFVNSVLGHRIIKYIPSALTDVPLNIAPKTPALLLYEHEPMVVSRTVMDLANKCQTSVESIVLSGVPGEEEESLLLVQRAMTTGSWVLMEHAQVCPSLLKSLSILLSETETSNESFRLWISAASSSSLPPEILLDCARFFVDTVLDMKSAVTRSLSWIPDELLRLSHRQEWPVLLHNICILHSALRQRTSIKGAGFNDNYIWDVQNLWDALEYAREEFTLSDIVDSSWGTSGMKGVSWIGLRKVLTQLVYGSQVTDFPDFQAVKGMIDQWISAQAVKKEFVAPKTKYKRLSNAFTSPLKVINIVNAVKSSNMATSPEMCGLLTTPETKSTENQHIMSCLNTAFELFAAVSSPILTPTTILPPLPAGASVAMPKTKRPGTPVGGTRKAAVAHRGIVKSSGERVGQSLAHLSHAAYLKPSKDVEFPELIGSFVLKVFKGWSKEGVLERLKRFGVNMPFSLWIKEEVEQMQKTLDEFRYALLVIKSVFEPDSTLTVVSPATLSIACDLFHNRIPTAIYSLSPLPPQSEMALANWISDLTQRCQHMDRALTLGHEKMPLLWLGAFFHPEGLLSIYKQNSFQSHEAKYSVAEQFSYSVEATMKDKELVREPPSEGLFVYGIHLWGATWDRTTNEVTDVASKHSPQPLPIVHVNAISQTEKTAMMDLGKSASVYSSPCYLSRSSKGRIIMNVDVKQDDVPALHWPLRGVICSLRPY